MDIDFVRERIRDVLFKNSAVLPSRLFFGNADWDKHSGLSFLKLAITRDGDSDGSIVVEIGTENSDWGALKLRQYKNELLGIFRPGRCLGEGLRIPSRGRAGYETRCTGPHLVVAISFPLASGPARSA